jgi:IS30 family transposase
VASHDWIYRHIDADQRRGGPLFRCLRRRRKQRRKRGLRDGRGQLKNCRRIQERPTKVELRDRVGDWEIDTMHASCGREVVVTLTERRSRLQLLAMAKNRTAEAVMRAVVSRLGNLASNVHTITSGNGKKFAEHEIIALALNADFHFADPHSPWQRGSNENANGLTRQYLPRNTDFSAITSERLREIENRLNTRPRKTLRYRPPRRFH